MNNNYEPVIGMEIHVELATVSKMFCGCPADHFGKEPNSQTCPVCLALPGALPVPNKKAVEWTMLLGLALGSEIQLLSKFDRKHYFYPDLPKGYQISQYDQPLCLGGSLGGVRIHRVHLEEDTGKLMHTNGETLVDFNRSGVPLVEIVTEPDIHSADQAKEFLKKLHQIVRYLGISQADMEKGSMRLEPNISVKVKSQKSKVVSEDEALPNYKVEVKNINSFNFVKRAIDYEVTRHIELLKRGEIPVQETRGWNENKKATFSQRSKEEAHDYRYFPEPDIPPMRFTKDQIRQLADQIPELPDAKKERFIKSFGLSEYDAGILTESIERAEFFERVVKSQKSKVKSPSVTPKMIANWMINKNIDITKITPEELIIEIQKATTVEQVSDDVIINTVELVLSANPKAVADFKAGKEQSKMFLFGNILRELKGKGDKKKVMELLMKQLLI